MNIFQSRSKNLDIINN